MTQQFLLQVFSLFTLLSFSSAVFIPNVNDGIYYGFDPFTGKPALAGDKNSPSPVNPACDNAIANANIAMTRLVQNLKPQAWNLYTEFDSLDEVSFSLKTQCKGKSLELINVGETGLNATQDLACENLMGIFVSLLEKKKTVSFTGALEGEITTGAKAKRLGKFLGDDCKPVLVAKKGKATDGSLAGSVDDMTKSAIAGSVEAAKTNLRIQKYFEKKGIELVFGKDDKDDANEAMPVDINSKEIL